MPKPGSAGRTPTHPGTHRSGSGGGGGGHHGHTTATTVNLFAQQQPLEGGRSPLSMGGGGSSGTGTTATAMGANASIHSHSSVHSPVLQQQQHAALSYRLIGAPYVGLPGVRIPNSQHPIDPDDVYQSLLDVTSLNKALGVFQGVLLCAADDTLRESLAQVFIKTAGVIDAAVAAVKKFPATAEIFGAGVCHLTVSNTFVGSILKVRSSVSLLKYCPSDEMGVAFHRILSNSAGARKMFVMAKGEEAVLEYVNQIEGEHLVGSLISGVRLAAILVEAPELKGKEAFRLVMLTLVQRLSEVSPSALLVQGAERMKDFDASLLAVLSVASTHDPTSALNLVVDFAIEGFHSKPVHETQVAHLLHLVFKLNASAESLEKAHVGQLVECATQTECGIPSNTMFLHLFLKWIQLGKTFPSAPLIALRALIRKPADPQECVVAFCVLLPLLADCDACQLLERALNPSSMADVVQLVRNPDMPQKDLIKWYISFVHVFTHVSSFSLCLLYRPLREYVEKGLISEEEFTQITHWPRNDRADDSLFQAIELFKRQLLPVTDSEEEDREGTVDEEETVRRAMKEVFTERNEEFLRDPAYALRVETRRRALEDADLHREKVFEEMQGAAERFQKHRSDREKSLRDDYGRQKESVVEAYRREMEGIVWDPDELATKQQSHNSKLAKMQRSMEKQIVDLEVHSTWRLELVRKMSEVCQGHLVHLNRELLILEREEEAARGFGWISGESWLANPDGIAAQEEQARLDLYEKYPQMFPGQLVNRPPTPVAQQGLVFFPPRSHGRFIRAGESPPTPCTPAITPLVDLEEESSPTKPSNFGLEEKEPAPQNGDVGSTKPTGAKGTVPLNVATTVVIKTDTTTTAGKAQPAGGAATSTATTNGLAGGLTSPDTKSPRIEEKKPASPAGSPNSPAKTTTTPSTAPQTQPKITSPQVVEQPLRLSDATAQEFNEEFVTSQGKLSESEGSWRSYHFQCFVLELLLALGNLGLRIYPTLHFEQREDIDRIQVMKDEEASRATLQWEWESHQMASLSSLDDEAMMPGDLVVEVIKRRPDTSITGYNLEGYGTLEESGVGSYLGTRPPRATFRPRRLREYMGAMKYLASFLTEIVQEEVAARQKVSAVESDWWTYLVKSAEHERIANAPFLRLCELERQYRGYLEADEVIMLHQIHVFRPRGKRYRPPRDEPIDEKVSLSPAQQNRIKNWQRQVIYANDNPSPDIEDEGEENEDEAFFHSSRQGSEGENSSEVEPHLESSPSIRPLSAGARQSGVQPATGFLLDSESNEEWNASRGAQLNGSPPQGSGTPGSPTASGPSPNTPGQLPLMSPSGTASSTRQLLLLMEKYEAYCRLELTSRRERDVSNMAQLFLLRTSKKKYVLEMEPIVSDAVELRERRRLRSFQLSSKKK